MSEHEDTPRLARDKWVPTELAVRMMQAVMPPNVDPRRSALQWLQDGSIASRESQTDGGPVIRGHAARHEALRSSGREWDLQSLILRLLALQKLGRWPVSENLILRLATIDPDELSALEFECLAARHSILLDQEVEPSDKAEFKELPPESGMPMKKVGRPPEDIWPKVLGYAAAWIAMEPRYPSHTEVKEKIQERFLALGRDPAGNTQVATYARYLLSGFREHEKKDR